MAVGFPSWSQKDTKSILPPPVCNERKESNLSWLGAKSRPGNLLPMLAVILLLIGLTAQVSSSQAIGTTPTTVGNQAAQDTAVFPDRDSADGTDRLMLPLDISVGSVPDQYMENKQELEREISHFDETKAGLDAFVNILGSDKNVDILLAKTSQTLSRVTRTTYCTISIDKLRAINTKMEETLSSAVSVSGGDSECNSLTSKDSIDYTSVDSCYELLNTIQCSTNDLQNEFSVIVFNNTILTEDLIKCRQNNSSLSKNVTKESDVNNSDLQKYQQENKELVIRIQELSGIVSDLQQQLDNVICNLCALEIGQGRYENAATEFKKLKNKTQVAHIVKLAYSNNGKLDSVDNIIQFVRRLPDCEQHRIAYQALFDVMKENNHLNSAKMPHILLAVKQCITNSSLVDDLVRNIIEPWSNEVRNSDYSKVLEFSKLSEEHANVTSSILPLVIINAYKNDLRNFNSVFNLVPKLPKIDHQYVALKALYSEMKKNNQLYSSEIIRLAYNVMEAVTNTKPVVSDEFQELKNSFPPFVWQLLERQICTIKSNYWNEYLYVPVQEFNVDNGPDRYAFTWLDKTWAGDGGTGDWELVPVDDAKYFYITNNHYPNSTYYLSQSAQKSNVICSLDNGNAKWKIEPLNINGVILFGIKNSQNESVYAVDSLLKDKNGTSLRRYLSIWRRSQAQYGEQWDFNCK